VASAKTASEPPGIKTPAHRSNLLLRIVSAAVMVPVTLAVAVVGGPIFVVFWTLAALAVFWEWQRLVSAENRSPVLVAGGVALIGSALLIAAGWTASALALLGLAAFGVAAMTRSQCWRWCVAGLLYAAALLIAPVLLRQDAGFGLAAILFLFAVVWLTDTVAYFCGRAIGGPKLMPKISPNKTWSGAVGGTAAAVLGGTAIAWHFGVANLAGAAVVAFLLSAVSQAGDLLESAIKRRFDAKDASGLIPGHGGLMDRVDGFVVAATVGVLIGASHGGLAAPARGLMVW
jgi:phosphatidate cytidylyltransferase